LNTVYNLLKLKTILVIDDYYQTLDKMSHLLGKAGFTVVTSSTLTPVACVKDINPNLILVGHRFRDGASNKFSNAIKADPQTSHIPVILLSGCPNPESLAQNSHADAAIAKSVDFAHLVKIIDSHLYT
jgi:response regulator RpfG family c-di-GMP phosphodiesterase